MPHQCTQCGHTFPDGSKEMLSGCPDCGGNKFQFRPAADRTGSASTPDPEPSPAEDAAQSDARREVASEGEIPDDPVDGDSSTGNEGVAGADAESDAEPEPADDEAAETEDSDMAALRRELDDQFESIKILEPGQYELNLMELYNREEYIVALQEDGQYVIDVPETWLGTDDER